MVHGEGHVAENRQTINFGATESELSTDRLSLHQGHSEQFVSGLTTSLHLSRLSRRLSRIRGPNVHSPGAAHQPGQS